MSRFTLSAVLLLTLAFGSGCGVIDYFFLEPPTDTAEELHRAGMDAMAVKDYDEAIEYFTTLKDRYPFSPYTPSAELALADAHFFEENYEEAVIAYKEFEGLHPTDEQIPYVLFQIGLANFRQARALDRPQTEVAEALQYFERVAQTYPETRYGVQAVEYAGKAKRQLAEHELYVADFFWQSGRSGSAWKRYQYVVDNYPELKDLTEYARKRAVLAYYEHLKEQSEQARKEEYGSWTQLFDWL